MLRSLYIRNVVLIDKLDLDFEQGLSVLTGETGAGKSILLDSLGLVLGNRAETSLIRCGEDKLSVTAVFDNQEANLKLQKLLSENELDGGDEIVIKRTLDKSGKGKIFVNDQPISLKILKEIGILLVEVHGQFDNHGLLNQANHRGILDAWGQYQLLSDKTAVAWNEYYQAKSIRTKAEEELLKARDEEENLRHWIKELEKINPIAGEEAELISRRQEMMNSEKIVESLNLAYQYINNSSDVASAIRHAQTAIDRANRYVNGKFANIYDALDRALVEICDVSDCIENASADINFSSDEQENIASRLFALKDLARKHGVNVDELAYTLEEFKQRLANIELGEDYINQLRKNEQEKRLAYLEVAGELHVARTDAANKLDEQIMKELPPLKMEKAKFQTQIEKLPESSWSEVGFDSVNFTVSTNPNSPQGALGKIASGGELARFMLALKVNLAKSSQVGTMIFDEVDAGIGGATAQAVGERLCKLGTDVQVLVVTHSPQVAAQGRQHYKVEKSTINNITTTAVYELKTDLRREEIARMLAGAKITPEARAAANALLDSY
ncbi:MAG: DNA repair protein RecN [Alphaproteobacteria bacterium]|nr:DNA repair protein RecN [Alphaproteobacteria bacterium]